MINFVTSTKTEVPIALAEKDELLVLVPSPKPEFDGKQRIIAQVDHPPHAFLLSFEEMNLPALDVRIIRDCGLDKDVLL